MLKPIHPFPARMAPELVWAELPDDGRSCRVLDPMAGSGTTLIAARLRGHMAVGFDRDPLAVLIAGTWLADIRIDLVMRKAEEVMSRAQVRSTGLDSRSAFPEAADEETKEFIRYWFDSKNRIQLTALAASIAGVRDRGLRGVLWCAFSRLIITKDAGVSLARDVSHSRPHRSFDRAPHMAFDFFMRAVQHIVKLAPFKAEIHRQPKASVKNADARDMPLADGCIDLIITSPPYLNAIDYLRGHKLSLVWMGHSIASLRALRATNVGTEVSAKPSPESRSADELMGRICFGETLQSRHLGMLRQYLKDVRLLLTECHRVLADGGKAVFVVGDCNLRDTFVANSTAIELLGAEVGFSALASRRRSLPENRRYLPPPGATSSGRALRKRMREEVIITLRKLR